MYSEHEPLPSDSPLQHMGNVMLAPHNANSSPSRLEAGAMEHPAHLFEGWGFLWMRSLKDSGG